MQTKFDIKDKVEPKNIIFVVHGIRVYTDGLITYDVGMIDEETGDVLTTLCHIPENRIDKFFAKGAKLL